MKVVFLENVKGVAKRGETKDVADGYARNFLLPQNKARVASDKVTAQLKAQADKERKVSEKELNRAQEMAGKLDGEELVIHVRVNEDKGLYASVKQQHIVQALKKLGHNITANQIKLDSPIKELGTKEVTIGFGHGLEADIIVIIEEAP